MANKLIKAIKQPRVAVEWLLLRSHVLYGMSDEKYLRFLWRLKTGKKLNLNNPQSYNEKLQWLKLHDRKPLYTTIVDKILVKHWVSDTLNGGGIQFQPWLFGMTSKTLTLRVCLTSLC